MRSVRTLTDHLFLKLKEIIKWVRTCASSLHLFASMSDGYLITLILQLLCSVIPFITTVVLHYSNFVLCRPASPG